MTKIGNGSEEIEVMVQKAFSAPVFFVKPFNGFYRIRIQINIVNVIGISDIDCIIRR